jgi:hypothetical protein
VKIRGSCLVAQAAALCNKRSFLTNSLHGARKGASAHQRKKRQGINAIAAKNNPPWSEVED